ncbi:coiled-coil domain-containing protein 134 [Halyomorpha halys]|uniref:coiled-coil domain-containing protein 134 n=1 Tax=Halyomorpha halys TaxID=286706 RepID=UPI0006D50F6B|nr:coiled-coil domain-containing protein 134 [Halyomorpha halys]
MVLYVKINLKSIVSFCMVIIFLTFQTALAENKEPKSDSKSAEDLFRRLYKLERTEQAAAIKALLKLGTEIKQSKMVEAIADRVFSVLNKSRHVLEKANFVPGESSFPTDENTRDALSNILENTAFLGDIILRLPDFTQQVIVNNTEWNELFKWSLIFANKSQLLDSKTITLLNLVNQEMNYTDRKPNFLNPYRKVNNPPPDEIIQEKPKKVKKKKVIPKGPRLSSRQFGEL